MSACGSVSEICGKPRLVDRLLIEVEEEIARLAPRQLAKAEEHGSYPPPSAQ